MSKKRTAYTGYEISNKTIHFILPTNYESNPLIQIQIKK